MKSDVKDKNLAKAGKLRIEWAGSQMKVLDMIKARFEKEKPLKKSFNRIIFNYFYLW